MIETSGKVTVKPMGRGKEASRTHTGDISYSDQHPLVSQIIPQGKHLLRRFV